MRLSSSTGWGKRSAGSEKSQERLCSGCKGRHLQEGMDMATVGTGKYTYELVEDWAKLPAGWTLGQTGIVTDARDRVYLFNRGEHPLIVLDQDGTFFTSWGEGA